MKALQFIGTQRSGSNLLRVMLNRHSLISSPHPPHILQVMIPFLPMYGSLSEENAFRRLIDDVCTLVELNPVNWGIQFDRSEIAGRCSNNSLPQIMKAVYETKAQSKGASIWCCKSMASIHYIGSIEVAGILPGYIFIYRDGRDVACSFRKAVVGEKHIYNLAVQWKAEQEKSLALCDRVGCERSVMVRYEDLIVDPAVELKRICNLLAIPFESGMLDYTQDEESKVTASSGKMWSNLVKPVMKDNTRKFIKDLSREDLIIFESVAGETLDALGYTREIAKNELRTFEAADINAFNEINREMQRDAKAGAADDMLKRKAQDDFISTLRSRFHDYEIANPTNA